MAFRFMTPSNDLLDAKDLSTANLVARSNNHSGISAQAFALRYPIHEVAPIAAADSRVFEVHPEVSFVRANEERTLRWSKSSWNGSHLRRRILRDQGIELPDHIEPAGAAAGADLMDAAIAAWSANRIATRLATSMPDGHARIGAIWA